MKDEPIKSINFIAFDSSSSVADPVKACRVPVIAVRISAVVDRGIPERGALLRPIAAGPRIAPLHERRITHPVNGVVVPAAVVASAQIATAHASGKRLS